ncbi:MAG: hypothetical protein K6F67_06750 [Oscillospiraceae bacterium]|nr:hypothetical protein [Oscillospiraceae bacterium]
MKKAIALLCVFALLLSLSACGPLEKIVQLVRPSEEPEPTATAAPEPTRAPKPTETPAPTKTPKPSHEPKPTPTPEPVVDDRPLLERICGTYIINPQSEEETQLDIYTVGGKLMAEYSGVYSFWGEELFPFDDNELDDTEADSIDLLALPYDGNSFTGSYEGFSFQRTLTLSDGGIVLSREGEPDAFYERIEPYDDVGYLREYLEGEQGPVPTGSWRGDYYDDEFDYHTVYLELNDDGTMYFLDRDETDIPRIMHGVYSSEDNGDGTFDLTYMMTERANYKMPHFGYFVLEKDGGVMYLSDPDESETDLAGAALGLAACGVGAIPDAQPYVENVTGGDAVYEDIDCDGADEEIYFEIETDDNGDISCITVYVDGYGEAVNITAYGANVYFMYTGRAGRNYLYFECFLDNDYRDILIYSLDSDAARFAGEFFGGFSEEPTDPYLFFLSARSQILSTSTVWKPFRVGAFGLPEALDTAYFVEDGVTLTIKRDYETWAVDMETGELIDYATIPAGTELTQFATDNKYYCDLRTDDTCYRIWVNTDGGWPQTIEGTPIDEFFDGLFFAG